MNVAQLQLVLGRLSSPAATEKPDLAGYEAQGESGAGWAGVWREGRPESSRLGPRDGAGLLGAGLRGGGLCPQEPL